MLSFITYILLRKEKQPKLPIYTSYRDRNYIYFYCSDVIEFGKALYANIEYVGVVVQCAYHLK